jgi:hypothetical protein
VQWILQRRGGVDRRSGNHVWSGISFVRSTRDVLARCMRETGVPEQDARVALARLPDTFERWLEAVDSESSGKRHSNSGSEETSLPTPLKRDRMTRSPRRVRLNLCCTGSTIRRLPLHAVTSFRL